MPVHAEHVGAYLERLRPPRSEVMREMEQLAQRDNVPIVSWETGRLLATLVRALDPQAVLEVGTAIGYSTLHMAEQLGRGRIYTLERDPQRIGQARGFFERAAVADKVEIVEGDALESIQSLDGPFDLLFLDASKDEYRRYLELAEPKLTDNALLAVDNLLMSGEVALEPEAETRWRTESLEAARAFNEELLRSTGWLGSVLPVGDGVGLAARAQALKAKS
jgi:predicted O-methyltransferase YrrM